MTLTAPARADIARDLIRRWDAQQTGYIRRRAERFDTMARAVAHVTSGISQPRVLDIAGGCGSVGLAIRTHVPGAHLVIADKDPLLLALADDAYADDPDIETARIDLDDPVWVGHAAIAAGEFDAVVSSTALHWLRPDTLTRVYFELASLVRPGGITLNGDHLSYDATSLPTLRALAEADDAAMQREAFEAESVDTWDVWWQAVADSVAYTDALAERERAWGDELHTPPAKVTLGLHLEALRSAGFAEVGTIWQYLDDHVVAAVR